MILYSVIMFLAAVPMCIMSILIYGGKTDLIHDYHQTNVTDKAAYGRAFGRAMLIVSAAMLLSGIVGLLGDSEVISIVALVVLFVGMFIGIACIIAVQKKYNNGVF